MCDKKEKGIYSIHCIENNKYYIGQTIDSFENRWWSSKSSLKGGYYHLYDLQADWNKYGENAFEFEIVHILKENENIDDLEVYYIDMYKNKYQCYNISLGGQRKGYPLGITRSDDFKKAISEKNRINGLGRKASKETKEKMSKSHIGKTLSKEQSFEISKRQKGKTLSEETKNKLKEQNKNKKPEEKYPFEIIQKMRYLHENEGLSARQLSEMFSIPQSYIYQVIAYKKRINK